ncbi:MAG: flagellar hook-length control protein FliK, partial [Hyphomicrobium sp.]
TAQELMTTSFGSMTSTISNETPVATLEPTRATQPPPEVLHARPEIVRNMEVVIDSGGHGSLGLQMSLNSKGLDLRVETSNADTAHLLNGDVDGLQARLLRSGLDVSSVNVHVTNDPTMSLPGSQPSNDERRGPWQQSSEANQSTSSGGGSGFHGGGEEAGAWKGRPNSQRPMSIVRQETTSRVTPTGSRTLFV